MLVTGRKRNWQAQRARDFRAPAVHELFSGLDTDMRVDNLERGYLAEVQEEEFGSA
jgi:hypothetical protein